MGKISEEKRPNVLWICADQLRFDTLSINGDPVVSTPNLERLAAMGVSFKNMYSQSPVCAPSRASFLTGRYPRTALVRQNGQDIPESERLISKIFSEHSYSCGLSGKLHLSACHFSVCNTIERRIGDGYDVFSWSHHPASPQGKDNWVGNEFTWFLRENGITESPAKRTDCEYVENGYPSKLHQTTWCTDKAIEFMTSARSLGKPFFYSVNYFDPHHPFDPPPEIMEKYMAVLNRVPLPNYTEGELETKSIFARKDHCGAYETPGLYPFDGMTDNDRRMIRASYYAMVELIDQNIGRLLDYLEENGESENTVVIFHSDHGELLGDHGIYLKGAHFYESCVHVPFIMAWKGHIAEGRERRALVEQVDIAPTLIDMMGWEKEKQMQGRSFAGLLEADTNDYHRDYVYSEFYNSNINHRTPRAFVTMVYDGRYKLTRIHGLEQNDAVHGELYDLTADPGENRSLYYDERHTEAKLRMLEIMTDAMASTCDPLPLRRSPW